MKTEWVSIVIIENTITYQLRTAYPFDFYTVHQCQVYNSKQVVKDHRNTAVAES